MVVIQQLSSARICFYDFLYVECHVVFSIFCKLHLSL